MSSTQPGAVRPTQAPFRAPTQIDRPRHLSDRLRSLRHCPRRERSARLPAVRLSGWLDAGMSSQGAVRSRRYCRIAGNSGSRGKPRRGWDEQPGSGPREKPCENRRERSDPGMARERDPASLLRLPSRSSDRRQVGFARETVRESKGAVRSRDGSGAKNRTKSRDRSDRRSELIRSPAGRVRADPAFT